MKKPKKCACGAPGEIYDKKRSNVVHCARCYLKLIGKA